MKLLVAGGRNKRLNEKGYEYLDELHAKYKFEELVNGCAGGIDLCAKEWADCNNIPVRRFPAKWKDIEVIPCVIGENKYGKYNKLAGLNRNTAMSLYCNPDDICVVFPGNSGSINMLKTATERGMKVINLTYREDLIK